MIFLVFAALAASVVGMQEGRVVVIDEGAAQFGFGGRVAEPWAGYAFEDTGGLEASVRAGEIPAGAVAEFCAQR
jgi:hypothetical protein